jgi:hypothetical protein
MNKDASDQIEWLKVLLAFGGAAILIFAFFMLPEPSTPPQKWVELVRGVIPSAVVVLGAFIALYFLFHRAGISTSRATEVDADAIAAAVSERLQANKAFDSGLLEFHQTFRNVDWKRKLLEAREHIDIVVYYFDSWVNTNFNELVSFFQRPKTSIRVFVADPDAPGILEEVQRLFPEYSKENVREKIMRTGQRIREAAKNAGASEERVSFYLVPHMLSYSFQVIDKSQCILSIFEMSRNLKIDSPAFVLDLARNRHLDEYFAKETAALLDKSKKA